MHSSPIVLIGHYFVSEDTDASLIELIIEKKANEINVGEFTQEIKNTPRKNWQAPFAEKYLDADGKSILGDDLDLPKVLTDTTRIIFFIYFLATDKPLVTPFGDLQLTQKIEAPKRVKEIILFENPE